MNKNSIYEPRGVNRIAWHDAVIANKMHTWQNERIATLNHMMMHKKCFHCFVPHFYSRKMHFDAPERFLQITNWQMIMTRFFGVADTNFCSASISKPTIQNGRSGFLYKDFAFMTVFTSHICTCNLQLNKLFTHIWKVWKLTFILNLLANMNEIHCGWRNYSAIIQL